MRRLLLGSLLGLLACGTAAPAPANPWDYTFEDDPLDFRCRDVSECSLIERNQECRPWAAGMCREPGREARSIPLVDACRGKSPFCENYRCIVR